MRNNGIEIVDRGRGPQLSTCRITVQDLVPYLQQQYTHEQIQQIMPVLTLPEIEAIQRYVQDHFDAVMEQDRRIRERSALRRGSGEAESVERAARLERLQGARRLIQERKQELNGDRASC